VNVPAENVSAMDGFAVDAQVEPGKRLPVAQTIAAGDPPGSALTTGTAIRIMTGAPVPEGADRIVPVEMTSDEEQEVLLREVTGPGAHIRRQGEIQCRGEPLLEAGSFLTPGALSLLAAHGHLSIEVHRRPRVSFLTTGDELVSPEEQPGPGQIRDTHSDFLLAAGKSMGMSFDSKGIAPDQPEALRQKIEETLNADVALLCGGVSMGEFDFVETAIHELGCRLLFDSVAVQPGKPLVAAVHDGGFVFGLPGNPASVMVSFWLFVRPVLRILSGLQDAFWHGSLDAKLAADLPGAKDRDRFLPAEVSFRDGGLTAKPVPPKGSHDVAAYARGMALVRVPAGAAKLSAGADCRILPLADWSEGIPAS
jgi:molybdenum cofactor synthesis domain-containing protein